MPLPEGARYVTLTPMSRRVASFLVYPVTTGGAVAFCAFALGHAWPVWAIGVVVIGACAVVVEGLERALPYSTEWARSQNDDKTDILHFIVSNRGFELGTFAAVVVLTPLGAQLSSRFD